MNELDLLSLNGFSAAIDRMSMVEAFKISPNIHFSYMEHPVSRMKYCVIKNVLQNPEMFTNILKRYPAYGGSVRFMNPGFRQNLNFFDFSLLTALWTRAYRVMTGDTSVIKSYEWINSTNIFYKGMLAKDMPHYDPLHYVANLWLTKDMPDCGTGLYKFKVEDREYFDSASIPEDDYTLLHKLLKYDQFTDVPWTGIRDSEHWERYGALPSEYNSAVVYCGRNFHAPNFYPDEWPEHTVRYSMVSFLIDKDTAELDIFKL